MESRQAAKADLVPSAVLHAGASVHHRAFVRHHFEVENVRFFHVHDGSLCTHPMRGIAPPAGYRAPGRVRKFVARITGRPLVEYCPHEHREVRVWQDEFDNLVVTAGEDKYLDATLKTGLASPAWYVGLKGTGTPADADTLASHASWSELTPYAGNRPAWTAGTIASGSVDNSASKAQFAINSGTTVYGAFLASVNTGTAGTLLGAGDFSGGSRVVANGDTLFVTVTCSIAGT